METKDMLTDAQKEKYAKTYKNFLIEMNDEEKAQTWLSLIKVTNIPQKDPQEKIEKITRRWAEKKFDTYKITYLWNTIRTDTLFTHNDEFDFILDFNNLKTIVIWNY